MIKKRRSFGSTILTFIFVLICATWLIPIVVVLFNSFKDNSVINMETFAFPNKESFVGFANYI